MALAADALSFYALGWLAIPLGLDTNGFPKRPLDTNWPKLTMEQAKASTFWPNAKGIGLVLGTASHGLCAVDVDDVEMADAILELFLQAGGKTRVVRTIRNRLHVYFIERTPSSSTALKVVFQGRGIGIELKSNGTQVATHPTPGYQLAIALPPMQVPSLAEAWQSIASKLGIAEKESEHRGNYPPPFRAKVEDGSRNKSLYVEAHKLREAGVALEVALEILQAHVQAHYEGTMDWNELRHTVESAYRKPVVKNLFDGEIDEHHYFR